jgi:hypothetical protein
MLHRVCFRLIMRIFGTRNLQNKTLTYLIMHIAVRYKVSAIGGTCVLHSVTNDGSEKE